MIVVKLSGGLGNQMLQYSFALLLRHFKKEVELDISLYQYINEHNGPEIFSLFPIEQSPELQRALRSFYDRERRLERYTALAHRYKCLPLLSPWKMRHLFRFRCKNYRMREIDLNVAAPSLEEIQEMDDCLVSGCPNPTYLNLIEEAVREAYVFPDFPSSYDAMLAQMRAQESVAVHVRRGDYLNYKGLALPDSYYREACEYVESQCPEAHYYVFSEDVAYVKDLFGDIRSVTFIEPNLGDKSYLDLFLMASCRHNIIANSTFSWWAAWLNRNPDKRVVKPRKWWYERDFAPISAADKTLDY